MAFDRDLGVALLRAAGPRRARAWSGWDMMAATGARGLRLLRESDTFGGVLFTEANPEAESVLRANCEGTPGTVVLRSDARRVPSAAPFDYVDLDPYGTPAPFVSAALAAVRPGGLLAVTATDMMVLAGAQPSACVRRYGASPVHGRLGPEGGLRILLAYVARCARSNDLLIEPVLSYVHDHHVRAYLRVEEHGRSSDPVRAIDPTSWNGPPLGDRGRFGPMWLGPLFDPDLVRSLLVPPSAAEPRRLASFLGHLREEVEVDVPFYYESNSLARDLGLPYPPSREHLLAELRAAGFRAARTHVRPEGFRTTASRDEVERAARAPARPSPRTPGSGRTSAPPEGSP
jgi:tRNA (guanine26-N2/guanine27-N2)-dimethyltransferase